MIVCTVDTHVHTMHICTQGGYTPFFKGAGANALRTVGSALVLVLYDQVKVRHSLIAVIDAISRGKCLNMQMFCCYVVVFALADDVQSQVEGSGYLESGKQVHWQDIESLQQACRAQRLLVHM